MDWAEQLLTSLEAVFGAKYDRKHWQMYVGLIREQPETLAQAVFNAIVHSSPKLPPVAVIVQTFDRIQEADAQSRDAQRSERQTDEELRMAEADMERLRRMMPLYADRELYHRYIEAIGRRQMGLITPEEMAKEREALLQEALQKRRGPQTLHDASRNGREVRA